MNREWKSDLRIDEGATASLPPAMVGETGWDVLLALSAREHSGLKLERLAALVSAPIVAVREWLNWLEDRELIASGRHRFTDEFGAVITRAGSDLVQNYLLATSNLQRRARQ